jgi:hypothetical protein
MARSNFIALRTFFAFLSLGPVTSASIAFAHGADDGAGPTNIFPRKPALTHDQMVGLMYTIALLPDDSKVSARALRVLGYNEHEAKDITVAVGDIAKEVGSYDNFVGVIDGTVSTKGLRPKEVKLLRAVVAQGDVYRLHCKWDGYTWEGSSS